MSSHFSQLSFLDENAKLKCGTDSTPVQSSITTNLVTDTMEKRKLEEVLYMFLFSGVNNNWIQIRIDLGITSCNEKMLCIAVWWTEIASSDYRLWRKVNGSK